jgi:hypothetical protein
MEKEKIICNTCKKEPGAFKLTSGEFICQGCSDEEELEKENARKAELAKINQRVDEIAKEQESKKQEKIKNTNPEPKPVKSEIIVSSKKSKNLSEYQIKEPEEQIAEFSRKINNNQMLKENHKILVDSRFNMILKIIAVFSFIILLIWANYNFGVLADKDQSINVPVNNQNTNFINVSTTNNVSPPILNVNVTTGINASINIINPIFNFYGNSS